MTFVVFPEDPSGPRDFGEEVNGSLKTETNCMRLITGPQHTELLANGRAARDARRADLDFDPMPVVNLFTPGGSARWLSTEIDPIDSDRAFGLCDLGHGHPDPGYVSLREIEVLHDKLGLRVERDLHFVANKPLSGPPFAPAGSRQPRWCRPRRWSHKQASPHVSCGAVVQWPIQPPGRQAPP